jgi:hypothetical protein
MRRKEVWSRVYDSVRDNIYVYVYVFPKKVKIPKEGRLE